MNQMAADLATFSSILEKIYRCLYCQGSGTDISCKDKYCFGMPCGDGTHMKPERCKHCRTTGYTCGSETLTLIKKYLPKEGPMSNSH